MTPNRVIEAAIRAAQDFLWQNAPPMHYVADEATRGRQALCQGRAGTGNHRRGGSPSSRGEARSKETKNHPGPASDSPGASATSRRGDALRAAAVRAAAIRAA